MMLIDGLNNVYMADRDHAIYHVPNLTYWKRKDLNAHLASTLVDGVRIECYENLKIATLLESLKKKNSRELSSSSHHCLKYFQL